MRIVSFELTMPNVASWNGRWSGEGKKYYVVKKFTEKFLKQDHLKTLVDKGRDNFYYRWEDGWGANVSVEIIDATEARKRRKISSGFCGYEWMIDSIIAKGRIEVRKTQPTTA